MSKNLPNLTELLINVETPHEAPFNELNASAFDTGRFSNIIQKNNLSIHNQQVAREDVTSCFILNFSKDQMVTLCRGWRWLSFNDGPQIHSQEHIREQMGYQGQWQILNNYIILNLTLDEHVCKSIGEYSQMIPHHFADWKLRCRLFSPNDFPGIQAPFLACQPMITIGVFGEDEPHLAEGVLECRWILLGGGNGLSIQTERKDSNGPMIQIENSNQKIEINSWERPFNLENQG